MAWIAPITFTPTQTPSAAILNVYMRDNLNELIPAKATQEGGIFVASGEGSISERVIRTEEASGQVSTSNTSYSDLGGPSITAETTNRALLFYNCEMENNNTNAQSSMSYEVDGSTSISASDNWALQRDGTSAGNPWQFGMVDLRDDLTAGQNTFTLEYRAGGAGTAIFSHREIIVVPL